MWFHWQNLSAEDSPTPRLPLHGRAWWHAERGPAFRIEWNIGSRSCGVALRFEPHDDDTVSGSVALPPLAFYWGVELPYASRLRRFIAAVAGGPSDVSSKYGAREFSLKVFNWAIWWDLWVDPGGWTNSRSHWRDGSFQALDWALGKPVYSSHALRTESIVVTMPEGSYHGVCKLTEDVLKRPRWFAHRERRAHVDMTEPVPFPGKGENSWDCGEDGLHGITCAARDVAAAVAAITETVLRNRHKRGGPNWRPEPKQPVAQA